MNTPENGENLPEAVEATEETAEKSSPSAEDAAAEAKKELLYLKAEFENYRKRIQRDQEAAVRFANERLIKDLLPTIDLFEKALEHASQIKADTTPSVKMLVEGIEMSHRELTHTLQKFGVEFIGKLEEPFDPVRHEAISEVESDKLPGLVVAVLNRGCLLHARLVQPARVAVSKKK